MRFGNPISGSPITPASVIQTPTTVLSGYAFPNNWTSDLFDVSGWDSLIVTLSNQIAASGGTITFTWFDATGLGPLVPASQLTTYLTLPQGASNLNAVKIRNLGAYVQITSTGWTDTSHSLSVWGTNRRNDSSGPVMETIAGYEWARYVQAAMGAGATATQGVWGRTLLTATGYCGPCRLTVEQSTFTANTFAWVKRTSTGGTIAVLDLVTTNQITGQVDFWAPPEPIQIQLLNLTTVSDKTVCLSTLGLGQ